MTLTDAEVDDFVRSLQTAYERKEPIPPLTDETEFSVAEAYRIQADFAAAIRGDDEPIAGHKLGLVSEAKQEQLGIAEPILGPVLDTTLLDHEPVPTDEMISPRLEAEIALVLDRDLVPPVRTMDVLSATAAVVPVVEILESRYQGWGIPSAQDVIADLSSAGKVIVGDAHTDVSDVDLRTESVIVSLDGEVEATGVGADIMGHPARPVAWLANRLADLDESLTAGELVMTGGITAAIDMNAGDLFDVEFGSIGSLTVRAE